MMRKVVLLLFPVQRTTCGPGNGMFAAIMKRDGRGE